MTKPNKEDKTSYWALVKFNVSAAHFSGMFSFICFFADSAEKVVKSITDYFLSKVDGDIEHQDDEDVLLERDEFEQRLKSMTDYDELLRKGICMKASVLVTQHTR